MNFDPTPAEADVLTLIRWHESQGAYNILCGGGHFHDYTKFPVWAGFKGSRAAGAYQFEPGTYAWIAGKIGLTDFTPPSQDRAALWLLRKVGPNSSKSWQASGPYPEIHAVRKESA